MNRIFKQSFDPIVYAESRFEAELVRAGTTFGKGYEMLPPHLKELVKRTFIGAIVMMLTDIQLKRFLFAEDGGEIKVKHIDKDGNILE